MNRRHFLHALALLAAASACPGAAAAARRAGKKPADKTPPPPAGPPEKAPSPGPAPARLVVVFLRGGVDALSVLPPAENDFYRLARPTTALAPTGRPGGVVSLSSGLGLHPALAPLAEDFQAGHLAFVQGVGLSEAVLDHATAQKIMEAGVGGVSSLAAARDGGWMARLALELAPRPAGTKAPPDTTVRAVFATPRRPLILSGKARSVNLPPGRYVYPMDAATLPDVTELDAALAKSYGAKGVPAALARSFREGASFRRSRLAALAREMDASRSGDPPVSLFPGLAGKLAAQMTRQPELSLAFLAFGGFDSHVRQGAAVGRLAEALAHTAKGLRVLAEGLASGMERTVVAVISEFGRSLAENGTGGTDNGHGGLTWLLGGPVVGGRLYGQPPVLAGRRLYREHLLPVTMDYRLPLAAVLRGHLGLSEEAVKRVFPGFSPDASLMGLIRARPDAAVSPP
ncbi:DUF1501 domain-containing protein [Desulfolutivibrio sulfodismutans]|nr:DUF1501 domain-containing protein [Desulfolutivibrio sulfodismutans]QLA13352.1 DUF1501 domain-containing protein [Desulfolutivibrio sulfodismutans DSM 3696]